MFYLQYFLCVSNPLPTPYAYRVFQPTAYVFFFTASPQRFTMLLCVFVVMCVVVVACVCECVCWYASRLFATNCSRRTGKSPRKYHRREFAWDWVNVPPRKDPRKVSLALAGLACFWCSLWFSAVEKLCSSVLLACPTGLGNIKCHQVCTTISQKNIFKVAKQLGKLESDETPRLDTLLRRDIFSNNRSRTSIQQPSWRYSHDYKEEKD